MADESVFEKAAESLKEGETYVRGVVTRVVELGRDVEPLVFFVPSTNVRSLELEGHRIATGELVVNHDKPLPKQFDLKRVTVDGDLKPGAEIGLVHLNKSVR